jgi:hypothetical protein
MFDLLKPTKRSECRFVDRRSGLEVDVLVQQTQLHTAGTHYIAAIRSLITPDETEDRALSSAVSAYKSYVFSCIHLHRSASQDILNSVGLMYF